MIRFFVGSAILSLLIAPAASAQELEAQSASPPQAIDILIEPSPQDATYENCSPEQEDAAAISGVIIVCRRITGSENRLYSKQEAEERYARETMNEGLIAAPDVAGAGIFRGPATVSGLCLIPPCPPPPAYMIDFSALPDAPPGSDADRIARGLPPVGARKTPPMQGSDEPIALSLPDPDVEADPEEPSPRGSASPEEPQSD